MQHHFHVHNIFKIKKELGEIFLSQILLSFSISLIKVFIPLYLISIGFSIQIAFLFYIFHELSWILFSPLSRRIATRFGAKQTIAVSIALFIMYFSLLLFVSSSNPYTVFLIGVLGGISFNVYWTPLNTEFVNNIDTMYESQEVGESLAFPKITVILSPFIGGLILSLLGYNLLFSVAVLLMIVSLIPFFFVKNYKIPKYKKKRKSLLWKDKRLILNLLFKGIYMSGTVIWAVYIFLLFNDAIYVGIAASLEGIAIMIFTIVAGWLGIKVTRKKLISFGALLFIIFYFLRAMIQTPLEVFFISFFIGVAWSFYALVVFERFSDVARKENVLKDCSERETILHSSKILPYVFLFLFPTAFIPLFLIISIVSIFALYVGLGEK